MKLLSSFLVAGVVANGVVDKKKCHKINGVDNKYRNFAGKTANVVGTHTALEFVPATTFPNGVNSGGIPNCLAQCDKNKECLFIVHDTKDNSCSMAKVKANKVDTIFHQ